MIVYVDALVIKKKPDSKSNQILLLERKSTGFMDNTYCLPGGKPQEHESLQNAIRRELEEEINIVVDPQHITFAHVMHIRRLPQDCIAFFFVITSWQGDPINKEITKHPRLDWFFSDQLPSSLMSGHRQAIGYISQGITHSELTLL